MKTVLITGSSSGIGKATAKLFQKHGWNVAATMRSPEKEEELSRLKNVKCCKLDVADRESIDRAVKDILKHFGNIDVVVNNAGYGTKGLFEAATIEDAKKLFDVNVFGIMNVMWAVLPHFRSKKSGVIINISSQAGAMGVPLNTFYNSSKYAVEGLSESIMYELESINVKMKLILLASINTRFLKSSKFYEDSNLTEYSHFNNVVMPQMKKYLSSGESPEVVAKEIYTAATDGKSKLRYFAGKGIKFSYRINRILPFSRFRVIVRKRFNL